MSTDHIWADIVKAEQDLFEVKEIRVNSWLYDELVSDQKYFYEMEGIPQKTVDIQELKEVFGHTITISEGNYQKGFELILVDSID